MLPLCNVLEKVKILLKWPYLPPRHFVIESNLSVGHKMCFFGTVCLKTVNTKTLKVKPIFQTKELELYLLL